MFHRLGNIAGIIFIHLFIKLRTTRAGQYDLKSVSQLILYICQLNISKNTNDLDNCHGQDYTGYWF